MTMTKAKLAAISGITLLSLASTGAVFAATTNDTNQSLASRIATKIGFKQEDVQKVLDAQHSIKQEDRQAHIASKLDQLVTDGKITADQKQKIIDKQKELETQREANKDSFKNLTPAERKAKMDAERTALEQWAKDNGIDIKYLMLGGRGHGHMGGRMGMMGGRGDRGANIDAPSL